MKQNSQYYANNIIEICLNKFWQKIAQKNIQRMAPKSTSLQYNDATQTLVKISFCQQYKFENKLKKQNDPRPIIIDNLASCSLGQFQKTDKQQNNKKINQQTPKRKKSFRSSKFISQKTNEKQQNKQNIFISSQVNQYKQGKQYQQFRKVKQDKINYQNKLKQLFEQRLKQQKKSQMQKQKMISNKGNVTYGYSGDIFTINGHKLSENIKMLKNNLSKPSVHSSKQKNIQQTQVILNKDIKNKNKNSVLQKQKPVFSQKSFSVVQTINDNEMAEGVKITQLRDNNSSISKEGKIKKRQNKFRLNDYKSMNKDKSFRQFSINSSRKESVQISIEQQQKQIKNIDQTHNNNTQNISQSGKEIKKKKVFQALGRQLPFIRTKGLTFYDIGLSKKLNMNSTQIKQKSKSKNQIKIKDISLYYQTINF